MSERAPAVWALTSYRAGETSQILALARRLGVPWARVDVDYGLLAGAVGLAQLKTAAAVRGLPGPPWPQLVISAGLKNEPVCRWLKVASGGKTRVVLLGRSWAAPRHFDLVVSTPQYRLAPQPQVRENPLTLHDLDKASLAVARERWAGRYGSGDAPRAGVLLGGNSGPYAFDEAYARRLADALNDYGRARGGRLLISDSSRTPARFLDDLCARLEVPFDSHSYRSPGENPYQGILAWSDELIVTADSIAMLSEAIATGKPVLLTEPSSGPGAPWRARLYAGAMRWGHRRWTRDVSLIHARLLAESRVRRLGDAALAPAAGPAAEDYVVETAAQIRKILAYNGSDGSE